LKNSHYREVGLLLGVVAKAGLNVNLMMLLTKAVGHFEVWGCEVLGPRSDGWWHFI
jgi:hypothetical protein